MFSLTLAKGLVYGALGLSLLCALATVASVIWLTGRGAPRWPWVFAASVVACVPVGWVWLYPSFVIGAIVGGELGSELGHHLSPTLDATAMAAGIGVGTYLVFTVPVAVLARLVGLAVTTQVSPVRDSQKVAVRTSRIRIWGAVVNRLVVDKFVALRSGLIRQG